MLAAHCQIWGGYQFLPIPAPKIAVDLFMLVSGFLMAANATDRSHEPLSEARNRVRFWTRRFFRIAPAYYLALALIALGSGFFLPGKAYLQALNPSILWREHDPTAIHYTADNLLAHVTFVFGLLPQYASSTSLPDWSLGLEMQFYLAFPFLFLLRPRHLLAVALAVVVVGGWYVDFVRFPEPTLLLFKLQYFAAGMLLYRALMGDTRQKILLLAAALVLTGIEQGRQWQIAPALLLGMAALGTLEMQGQLPKVCASRLVTYASDVSYSVYLFHGLLLGAFGAVLAAFGWKPDALLRTFGLLAVVVPCTYLLAGVTYRFVELPGIRLGRHVLHRGRGTLVRVPDRQEGL